jgi:hypothetical protein
LSFLITTPDAWVSALGDAQHGFPYLSGGGRLVLKDVMLLAGGLLIMADSARAFLEARHIANSAKADPEYGAGVAAALTRLAGGKEAADDRQSARRPKKEKADVGA